MADGAPGTEEQLKLIVDSVPGLLAYVDKDQRYVFVNRTYAEFFEKRPEELPGRTLAEMLGPEPYAQVRDKVNLALQGHPQTYDRQTFWRGGLRDLRATYTPHFDANGGVLGLLILVADFTDQARAERALRASEEQFRTLLANTPDIISRFDRAHRFLYISPAVEKVLGLTQEFHIGKRHEEVGVPSAIAQMLEARLEEIFTARETRSASFDMPNASGQMRHYEGLGIPEFGANGEVETVLTIVRDVTPQFEAGKLLRDSEARFRNIVETASEGIWMIDLEGFTRFANDRMCELLGCTQQELASVSCFHFLHPEDMERARLSMAARRQGVKTPAEYRARRGDGTDIWLQITASPTRNEQGEITGLLGMCTDVTDRVERDSLIRASEERFRSLVTATSSIVWTAAPDGSMKGDTSAWLAYTGRAVPAGPQPWASFLHPDDIPAAAHAWETAAQANGVLEHTARVWHGATAQYRWCITRATPLLRPDGTIREWIGTTTDIHDRREAEARYEALFNASRDGILIVDDEGRYIDVNPAYCALLKSTREDLLGRIYIPFIPEDRVKEAQEAFATLKREGRYRGEFPLAATDGSIVELDWTSVANFVPGLHCCMARDVTERRQFEQQLQQTQKLESLGVLAGGIAHDFNNLLVGMMGNASLAMDAIPVGSAAATMLQDVMKASDRAAQLTRQLLAYAGKARLSTEPVFISKLVGELAGLLSASIPRTVHLRLQLSPDPLVVEADATQLQQIVMNLVINAAESIPQNAPGVVTVTTSARQIGRGDRENAIVPLPDADGEYVVLRVSDTGCGMSREVRERIFDPFFTTKFQGRGLGLSAVLGIIKSHRGGLTLRTEHGKGTTFEVFLPQARAVPATHSENEPLQPRDHSGAILVVDDEEMVRSFLRRVLSRAGFDVIDAPNGHAAIQMVRGGVPVRAVILDLAMPVMTGDQAAPELRRLRPDLPIVLSSGYPEAEAMARFAHTGVSAFLQKPYTSSLLLARLAELLAGTAK